MSRMMFGKIHLIYRTLVGNEYPSDGTGKMTNVREGDVRDLVSVGCVDRDIATQAVLGGIPVVSGDGTKALMGDGTFKTPSGGISLPLPFFGASNPPWVRPALNIGGPSNTFNTWLNQTSAVATNGVGGAPLELEGVHSGTSSFLTSLLKPIGAPPWTITVMVAGILSGLDTPTFLPLVLYDSVNHKAVALGWVQWGSNTAAPFATLYHYEDTTPDGTLTNIAHSYVATGYILWFRVVNDGTNLTFFVSSENLKYRQILQEPADSLTPSFDYVGFGIERALLTEGSDWSEIVLWNWVQT